MKLPFLLRRHQKSSTATHQQLDAPSPPIQLEASTILPLLLSGMIFDPSISRATVMDIPDASSPTPARTSIILPNPKGEAARLLLDNASSNSIPMTSTARAQLRAVQKLQDDRLDQCEKNGTNWEQCFFYGTPTSSSNSDENITTKRQSSFKIPTW